MLSSNFRFARRIISIRRSRLGAVVGIALAPALSFTPPVVGAQASAQVAVVATPDRTNPRRQILEDAAKNFERLAGSEKNPGKKQSYLTQAQLIRKRLAEGDFQPGHRILLFVAGDSALSDTFTVRGDQKLQMPNLPEISLAGVLDSELQPYLQTELAKYIRNPSVRAQALVRVLVSGDVANPGFYPIRTDTPVSDVIMNAGGPSSSADVKKTELRRGSSVVVNRDGIQTAIRSEMTMSDIGARPGDELYVPANPTGSRWAKIAAMTATITGIIWTVIWISDR